METLNPSKRFNINLCKSENCVVSTDTTDIVQKLFAEAEKLILGNNSICPSLGSVNTKLGESKSGSCIQFVMVKPKCRYSCDSDCAMFKCIKVCSHTIACEYCDNYLQPFLNQATSVLNLYELAKSDTKQNPGKRPLKQKVSSKSTAKAITELRSINC